MRQIINEKDLVKIIGRFVVQLNDNQESIEICDEKNDGFWLEKRISFVGQLDLIGNREYLKEEFSKGEMKQALIVLNGIYYCHGIFTKEKFVQYFNTGAPTYDNKPEGEKRFFRLLTSRELEWLFKQLKTINY